LHEGAQRPGRKTGAYHGVHILENDGQNNFQERYVYPLYGAAQAVVAEFDRDGDLDILA